MLAVLILLNLLIIPLIIDDINIPLFKDDICKFEDDLCGHGSDGSNGSDGDNRTSSKGRRHRRTHGIKKNRYLYLLDHAPVQF